MQLKIIEEKQNPLFKRKEVLATIETEVVPSKKEVEKLLSDAFSTQAENIKIKNILSKFGSRTFTVNTNIYASKEDKDYIEPKTKKEIEKEKKAAEAKKSEESKVEIEEKPTEVRKEEGKQ